MKPAVEHRSLTACSTCTGETRWKRPSTETMRIG